MITETHGPVLFIFNAQGYVGIYEVYRERVASGRGDVHALRNPRIPKRNGNSKIYILNDHHPFSRSDSQITAAMQSVTHASNLSSHRGVNPSNKTAKRSLANTEMAMVPSNGE